MCWSCEFSKFTEVFSNKLIFIHSHSSSQCPLAAFSPCSHTAYTALSGVHPHSYRSDLLLCSICDNILSVIFPGCEDCTFRDFAVLMLFVACFTRWSAILFPVIPAWALIQLNTMVQFLSRRCFRWYLICLLDCGFKRDQYYFIATEHDHWL